MNTPPDVSVGSPEGYHDPVSTFDLSSALLRPNGGYDEKQEIKEEDVDDDDDEEEEEEPEDRGYVYDKMLENEEEAQFTSSSSGSSGGEADEEHEEDPLEIENDRREKAASRLGHSMSDQSEQLKRKTNYMPSEHNEACSRDGSFDPPKASHRTHDDGDQEDVIREGDDEEEEDEEDEGEDDDDIDEEDRIKETQKLVAKIEHDIQGLRFQAKQRGHLLSDLHRYGAQNKQRKQQQEHAEQSTDLPAVEESPQLAHGDEGKIIERPVSIKLRLRTRSSSPKASQETFVGLPVVKAKPGKVKMRVLRIGKQLGRWDAWKENLAVKGDRELAKIMMDHMDRTYFQQFLPSPKPEKVEKRKKKQVSKSEPRTKKPKQVKVIEEEPEEWADGYFDDDLDDIFDPEEEKDDFDYDPSHEDPDFGAYKPSNPVRNKRKSRKPRKLIETNSPPRAAKPVKSSRPVGRPPKVRKVEEKDGGEPPVKVLKKRGRKPKPKTEVITSIKKPRPPRIHRGGRRPSLMSTLRNIDWNALPRRYECKICCLRFDGITAFKTHLESTHHSEYHKSKDLNNHKNGSEENSNDAQEAEKRFQGSEKPYQESEKQYEDLGHMPEQHSSMRESEQQRRMAESDMYRTMAYGQDVLDSRRFEMMPPFKRHLHESYSNEWGKMQGNMYSRPLGSGQMMPGEQSWGPNRGYDPAAVYRKHYEDGREWGKGGGQYPHVITSLGQNMQMGIDGGEQRQEQQQTENYTIQGSNIMSVDHAPSQESTYVDMSIRQTDETPNPGNEGVSRNRIDSEEQGEGQQESEPPPPREPMSGNEDKEAEDKTNDEDEEGDEEEKDDENETGTKKKKRKKTKPFKEWEEIDRWAITFVHCPQCDDYIRFRPGQKNFHFAVHAERRLCQECGKMFTKEAFRAHVRVHQAKRLGEVLKHVCDVCGKAYRFKCSLSSHMRCHTGVRDFDCKICGKKFLSAHGLEKHELVHRKVKPHMCPDCGRGFTQFHNMLAHRRQHTGEKPYRCNLCERSFTHNVSLKNHKKKEHGIDLWEESGGKAPSANRQRSSKSTRSAPVAPASPPVPQAPSVQPKPSVPNERELMHTLDPSQLYSMMPTLDYGHY